MKDDIFYEKLETEIDLLLDEFKNDKFLQKQDNNGRKSYGLLLWFLKNYLPQKEILDAKEYITEGEEDSSCDIIFENENNLGENVFYVIQSKWFIKSNINKRNETTKDLKACLADFRCILKGDKQLSEINLKFNQQYGAFLKHKERNGKIKFVFLALCKGPNKRELSPYLKELESNLIGFNILNIFKLKKQYIEQRYKGARTHNPIETPYEPKRELNLEIIKSQHINMKGALKDLPSKAYIFLVRPLEIYKLFDMYGHSLFYKNIRNPLARSFYNQNISLTLKKNPSYFWYFNNGITAITEEISEFHSDAERITLKGIQIINGAQTVFSIYSTYKFANDDERSAMDRNCLITIRILRTLGHDFDLNVTRYTNSQNPIQERDFHSNDDIQKRIQSHFLKSTNIWYETRRGEYRKKDKSVLILSNQKLAQTYLAYSLKDPHASKAKTKLIFNTEKDGLYGRIFNDNLDYKEMLVSYYLYRFIESKREEWGKKLNKIRKIDNPSSEEVQMFDFDFLQYSSFDILALFKNIFLLTNENNINFINTKLISYFETGDTTKILPYYNILINILKDFISLKKNKEKILSLSRYFKSVEAFNEISKYVELQELIYGRLKL